jgi:hypothetical protein
METKQQQPLADRLILLSEENAELKIRLKAALLLLDSARPVYEGQRDREWHKQLAELLEGVNRNA